MKLKMHLKNVFYFILAIRNGASLFGGKYFYTLLINKIPHNRDQNRFDEAREMSVRNARGKRAKVREYASI